MSDPGARGTVLYDGTCGFCRASVRRLQSFDPRQQLHFIPRESAEGQALCVQHAISAEVNSMILLEKSAVRERVYTHSTAVLRSAALTGGWLVLARLGLLVPRFLRDAVYGFISRRRRQWSRACEDGCARP